MPSGRGIVIEVIGDDRSALRMWERQIAGAETTDKAYKKVALTAQQTAAAQVAASLKVDEARKAQIANLRAFAVAQGTTAEQAARANLLADAAAASFARSQGRAVTSTDHLSKSVKTGERDLNKLSRGLLAGSGLASELGRSLAFASSGFIAFAAGATLISRSIGAARDLAVAQRQVVQQFRVSGKSFASYGEQIDRVTTRLVHLSGFTHVDLLNSFTALFRVTGNVSRSLQLTAVAANVARGRHITLTAASNALAKAAGGSFSALRRLNIVLPQGVTKTQALAFVTQKFAGQAQAGTSTAQRFSATLNLTEEIIGERLLPTLNRFLTSFGNWLTKMNESGRLEKDVNDIISVTGDVFHSLGKAIGIVDKVTGSFANTLKVLIGLRIARLITTSWIPAIVELAAKWGLVTAAATEAGAAQTAAATRGIVAGEAAAAGAAAGAAGVTAGALALPATVVATGAFLLATGKSRHWTLKNGGRLDQDSSGAFFLSRGGRSVGISREQAGTILATELASIPSPAVILPSLTKIGGTGVPSAFQAPGFGPRGRGGAGGAGPFGAARPQTQFFTQFRLSFAENLAQIQASLTRSTRDDVTAARAVVARIKKLIDEGRLHGQALVQALGLEASALSTIWSAEDAIAQKRAQRAQAAKARAEAAFANLVDPLKVEVQLLRAQAAGRSTLPALRALLRSARQALASAKTLAQQQAALQQIVSVQQQIKDATTTSAKTFTQSLKLQLALARAQAFGQDTGPILQRMRRALLRALHSGKFKGQALIDLLNQITDINQQINDSVSASLNFFKQANTRQLTKGLGLTATQRAALRARLSQLGPHGAVPGSGVGAAGFVIGTDGRPLVVHTHVNLDGKRVADNTTRHQQRRRRRNSRQRRGPNAG